MRRRAVVGPAVVAEPDCTVWVPDGWRARPGTGGRARAHPRRGRARADDPMAPTTDDPMAELARSLDPAALQVLISRLTGVAEEMGAVLRRAAFSPNIKERADCSAALFTADGELLVQAEHIPVHLGSMPASVARRDRRVRPTTLAPGEQVVLNDPFAGGTHLNDVTLVAPCFVDGRLVGWAANRAHHADVGGMAPGSIPADATEIHAGGPAPPAGAPDRRGRAVLRRQLAHAGGAARRPRRAGRRQRASASSGWPRSAGRAARRGRRLRRAAHAGRAGRAARRHVVVRGRARLDRAAPDQQRPARIAVTLTVDGETATFDFTGTDAQRPGNVNAVEAVTVSARRRSPCGRRLDPTIPANGGAHAAGARWSAPPGTVVAGRRSRPRSAPATSR